MPTFMNLAFTMFEIWRCPINCPLLYIAYEGAQIYDSNLWYFLQLSCVAGISVSLILEIMSTVQILKYFTFIWFSMCTKSNLTIFLNENLLMGGKMVNTGELKLAHVNLHQSFDTKLCMVGGGRYGIYKFYIIGCFRRIFLASENKYWALLLRFAGLE